MRILLCIRGDYLKNFAGDSMLILKTAEYLRKLGVDVDINNGYVLDYSSYDIVHLFNLTTIGETYKYYKLAHKGKKNIVISPLYRNLVKYYTFKNDIESIRLLKKSKAYREEIVKGCKMLYVNSEIEKNTIEKEFTKGLSFKVIYNGVQVENDDIPLYNFKERFNLNNYVLCVGRITPEKNQLELAKACSKLGATLVLSGIISDNTYFNECMKYENVRHLGFIDSYNVYNAYRFAKVHVLPSFLEMPGQSSLEAAASGCNIISTIEGSAEEYFKDMALYCDPYDPNNILDVLEQSLKQKKSCKLKNFVKENYDWNKYINSLYESYKKVIIE